MELDQSLCPAAFVTGLDMTSKTPYAVGIDPTWHGSRTELQYLNSVKMKLSIILGTALLPLQPGFKQKHLVCFDIYGRIALSALASTAWL